jgi:putative transposase
MFVASAVEVADDAPGRPRLAAINGFVAANIAPSPAFIGALEQAGVRISMDGRGRFLHNIFIERLWRSPKHEDIYLKHYAEGREARAGIATWIGFYNCQRPHQALGYKTPMSVWCLGQPARSLRRLWT